MLAPRFGKSIIIEEALVKKLGCLRLSSLRRRLHRSDKRLRIRRGLRYEIELEITVKSTAVSIYNFTFPNARRMGSDQLSSSRNLAQRFINKTRCTAATNIGMQVHGIKHCDHVVTAGFKRCDACVSSYAMILASLMITSCGLGLEI